MKFKHPMFAALSAALALALATSAVAQQASPEADPLKIADLQPFAMQLDAASYAKAVGGTMQPIEIRTADAAFIKVHFDRFSLPEGVELEVASPDGSESYRYGKSRRDPHTVSKELGQNGDTSFSAMSITGPVAVIRLVGTAREPWGKQHGVQVSQYLEGFPESMLPELQSEGLLNKNIQPSSICGTDNKRAAACYSSSEPSAFDRSRPVARLVMSGGGLCTAWRVGADNRMFTNNHCVASTADVAASEVWFNYQLSTCGGSAATVTKVPADVLLKTDATLDYSLFTVKNFSTISSFGYLGLDVRTPNQNELIYISGHPGGRQKELSIVSDQDGGGYCTVNAPTQNGNGTNTDSGYTCDTEGGSSGSPVLARSSNRVIALHHLGGCNNSGAKIALIWPQVSSHFGGTIPVGDNDGTPPPPPPPPPGTVLSNGVAVPGLGASAGSSLNYTMVVPAGATGLKFVTTGGTGDMDLYVKFGSAPTDTSYDCRPYTGSSAETCNIATAQAGTYYVRLKAYTTFSGVSLTGSYTPGGGGGTPQTYTNGTDVNIPDNNTTGVYSNIVVSGRTGNGAASSPVAVSIVHPYIGDLIVDLVAPDGSVYNLHNRSGGSADNINTTVNVNLSGEALNGTWRLRARDAAAADVGNINSWSVTF